MSESLELTRCEPAPFIYGANGHIAVTDGSSVWVIVVTFEALQATAQPADASLKRLVRFSDLYIQMAEASLSRGEVADGKIWIFENDIITRHNPSPASVPGPHGMRRN